MASSRGADTTLRVHGEGETFEADRLDQGSVVGEMRAPVMIVDRKTISIMNACKLVGVSRRTIYNWIASGKVEYVRTAGGSVRIFVDTLWREPETDSSQLTSAQPDA